MKIKSLYKRYSVKDLYEIADTYDAEVVVTRCKKEEVNNGRLQHFAWAVEDFEDYAVIHSILMVDMFNKLLDV